MSAPLAQADVDAFVHDFKTRGYGIVRQAFTPEDVAAMKTRFDAWYALCLEQHGDECGKAVGKNLTYLKGNHRVWMGRSPEGAQPDGRFVRGIQWPCYTDGALDALRTDPRLYQILSPLLGSNIKQLINQMHWKLPGSTTQWRYHQDVRSRKPDEAFRDLANSYVQVGIAVERFDGETGGMEVVPFSQVAGVDLGLEKIAAAMGLKGHGGETTEQYQELLRRAGVNPADLVQVDLKPGDLVAWGPFMIHGGGLNTSKDETRAFFINGYVTGDNCDRGHVAWLDGVAQPLGEPCLVQMDNYQDTVKEGKYFDDDVTGLKISSEAKAVISAVTTVRD